MKGSKGIAHGEWAMGPILKWAKDVPLDVESQMSVSEESE